MLPQPVMDQEECLEIAVELFDQHYLVSALVYEGTTSQSGQDPSSIENVGVFTLSPEGYYEEFNYDTFLESLRKAKLLNTCEEADNFVTDLIDRNWYDLDRHQYGLV